MKGIYFIYKASSDPSPAGYWMPGGGVFSGFTTTGEIATTESQFNVSGSFINGWNYLTGDGNKTIFFPASGYRNYTNGNLENIGNNGSCWSQYLIRYYSGHEECRALYFDYQYVNPTGTYSPSYALPVRPVKE